MITGPADTLGPDPPKRRGPHDGGAGENRKTLEELAETSGVSARAISDMERGRAVFPGIWLAG